MQIHEQISHQLQMNKPAKLNSSMQVYLFALLAAVMVAFVYGWLNFPSLEKSGTNYYPQLAIGFKNGELSLPEQPSEALLSLSNPYNYVLRKESGVEDFPWDASLYQGRFYIYWGPVPAALLTVLPVGLLNKIGDQHLVFPFVFGVFIYSLLIVVELWSRLEQRPPAWALGLALLALGIASPATLMLSRAKIYEASISASQFFFLGGCYWAFRALGSNEKNIFWQLVLAAFHWALAIGSRTIILPAAAFVGVVTIFFIWKKNTAFFTPSLFAMGAPIFIVALGLCWYNWARFGSVFEFGLRYQLTTTDYNEFNNLFSVRYLRENLLSYFLRPYQIQAEFPFISTVENTVSNDRLAGLPYTSPHLLFLLLPLARFFSPRARAEDRQETWLINALGGASLISLVIILLYYFTAMRFSFDFMPGLLVLAVIHFMQGYGQAKSNQGYLLLAVVLFSFSILLSTLIALPAVRIKEVFKIFELLGIR